MMCIFSRLKQVWYEVSGNETLMIYLNSCGISVFSIFNQANHKSSSCSMAEVEADGDDNSMKSVSSSPPSSYVYTR